MSKSSIQTAWNLDIEGVEVPIQDRELQDRMVPGIGALLGFVQGFVQGVWARSTNGQRSSTTMVFEDRHSAAALIGLFGIKHG
jgi:hypothetical protein